MEKNPLLHRLMKTSKEEVLHSSGYAQTQNGESMGAASAASFAARQAIDQARSTIKKYGASKIANNSYGNTLGAKRYEPNRETTNYVEKIKAKQSGGDQDRSMNNTGSIGQSHDRSVAPPVRKNPGIFR